MPTAIMYYRLIGLFGGQSVILETVINPGCILPTLRRLEYLMWFAMPLQITKDLDE